MLDAGCGTGDPIAAHIAGQSFGVTGIDASDAMLAMARERHPDGDWRLADMRGLDLGERFDGIIGWNSFFPLTPGEQRATIARFADHLAPGGALMLTVGPDAGEVVGHVGDDPVYHASLSPGEYETVLRECGLSVVCFVAEDPDCDFQSILLALKA